MSPPQIIPLTRTFDKHWGAAPQVRGRRPLRLRLWRTACLRTRIQNAGRHGIIRLSMSAAPLPSEAPLYCDVSLPVPLDQAFTYRLPETIRHRIAVGCRVLVPFGSR